MKTSDPQHWIDLKEANERIAALTAENVELKRDFFEADSLRAKFEDENKKLRAENERLSNFSSWDKAVTERVRAFTAARKEGK